MGFTGTVERGIVKLPPGASLADGTKVRVEPLQPQVGRHKFASADLMGSVDGQRGPGDERACVKGDGRMQAAADTGLLKALLGRNDPHHLWAVEVVPKDVPWATCEPEPSTLALAGLGGLSLLLFRRRK